MQKEIEGFHGKYFVDENGTIYSVHRQGNTGDPLKHTIKENGYERVTLRDDGKRSSRYVHRLVAEAFIPNPLNKPCINHKDGNKSNNSVDNLEWVTYSENMKHCFAHGMNHAPCFYGEDSPVSKLKAKDVLDIRELFSKGEKPSELAKRYNVTPEQISNVVKRIHWKTI